MSAAISSESKDAIIQLSGEDDSSNAGESSGGKTPAGTKYLDLHKQGMKFLERIRWKSLIPGGSMFALAGGADDVIGDLSLYSAELYKEYILCVGGTSQTHAPFRGYRFIPALHVTDTYLAGCCCCTGKWTLGGVWRYKEATGDIPPMRIGQKTALINNTLFLFGGRVPGTERLLNDLYALDLEAMIWTQLSSKGKQPSPRIRHTLTYVDGFLYLLGGNGANQAVFVKDSFWRYDIKAGSWDELPPPPTHAGHIAGHVASALPQGVLVFGGCSTIFAREPNQLLFDVVGGGWTTFSATTNGDFFKESNVAEDHAVCSFEKAGAKFFVFHGGISADGATNQFSILKLRDGEFEWFNPIVKDVDLYRPPIELSKHNIIFVKGRVLFLGGTTQFARESEELARGGCCKCFVGSYKATSTGAAIPMVELFEKSPKGGCCTIS